MDKLPDIADNLADVQDMLQQEIQEIPPPPPPPLMAPAQPPLFSSLTPPPPSPHEVMVLSRLENLEKTLADGLAELRGYAFDLRQEAEHTAQAPQDTAEEALSIPMELVEPEPVVEKEKPKKRRPHL